MRIQEISSDTHASSSSRKYDVFLSFRGEDTRKKFTDHLYAALNQKGIHVFKDDKGVERGESISLELHRAIEESRFSIVIFSENYASSTWCLDELVKIVECIKTREQIVIPIFYDVDPSVVRKQTKSFQKAFSKHEETFTDSKLQEWRNALSKVANLSGWDAKDRHESEFIQEVVKEISNKLSLSTFMDFNDLIGIDSHLEKLKVLIDTRPHDVCMIGICGMGGIGKTTIARVVYELKSCEFDSSCFLANIREISEKEGVVALQKQLLSQTLGGIDINIYNHYDGIKIISSRLQCKKVLLILDDVAHVEQLHNLAGRHHWFGSGSRIIITTRDNSLLMRHGVNEVYKAEELNGDDSIRLFSLKAFKDYHPPTDYIELSKRFVEYAAGIPLALEILGCFLFGRPVNEWISELERLEKDPEKEILDILQISFDGLKETEKNIFLDIACFFKGKDKDYVTRILEGCGFYPTIGIAVLVNKSLINICEKNTVWMHDLLQEMGQQIVKRESKEPGKRSRLWEEADVHHVLTKNTGTEVVEGIIIEKQLNLSVSATTFSKMVKLRLLRIDNVQLPKGLEYLSNELRLLEWYSYPLKSLPWNLQVDKIVTLEMHFSSKVEQLWRSVKLLNMLTTICLKHCSNLNALPDLRWAPNLERLEIIDCPKVKKIPEIVGALVRLRYLIVDGTTIIDVPSSIEPLVGLEELILTNNNNLVTLPSTVSALKSLKSLNLSGCSKLENLPETLGQVEILEKLDLSGTAITEPRSCIFLMKNLKELNLRGCKGPPSNSWGFHFLSTLMPKRSSDSTALILPSSSSLPSLTRLDLGDCNIGAIPHDFFASLFSLKKLNLSKNNFASLPPGINRLPKLEFLYLSNCKRLQSLPELPPNTCRLDVNGCASLEISSNALKAYNSEWLYFTCMNCLKLLNGNSWMFSLLKYFLEVQNTKSHFNMVVPGSEIPKWLMYQSAGSSITIERPQDLYNNKVVGYVVCCIFVVHKHQPILYNEHRSGAHTLYCDVHVDGKQQGLPHYCTDFDGKFGRETSEHLWLLYLYPKTCVIEGGRHLHKRSEDYNNIKLSFKGGSVRGLEVKRCAVHPIYDKDLKEFNPNVDVATSKRRLAFNADDEEPQPEK